MKAKLVLQIVLIAILSYANYQLVQYYSNEYVPDSFNISKIVQQKYRCIRHFSDKTENKYLEKKCKIYAEDYEKFKSDIEEYQAVAYTFNMLMHSIFIFICLKF